MHPFWCGFSEFLQDLFVSFIALMPLVWSEEGIWPADICATYRQSFSRKRTSH